jgi:hypothetical protein
MKKLFKAGLAVFSMALLATSASAFSPSWSTLPDVLIGGCEPGGLVFTDAFNVFDYLTDDDNTSPQLSVFFAEGPWAANTVRSAQVTDGSTSNEVGINGEAEADYSGSGDLNINIADVPAGGGDVSTNAGELLFATATDLIDRAVVLIASDGFTSPTVSKVFRVRSDSAACDDVSFPVTSVTVDQWNTQAEFNADWVFVTFNVSGTAATSGATGDALIINAPLVGQNVSNWILSGAATKIPSATPGVLRSRWTINSSAAASAWPAVRMRMFANDNQNPANLLVSANGYVPAPSISRTYQMFYEAPAGIGADLNVGFYVVDTNDAQGGAFTLEQLVVDAIVGLDSLYTDVQVIDTGESLTMNNVNELGISTTVTGAKTADAFTFTAAAITGTNFSFEIAQLNNAIPSMATNTLYRLVSTVTSTTAVTTQPGWGFRLIEGGNLISNVNRFLGQGASSAVLATTTPKDYVTYLTSEGIDGNELRVAFDMIHNNASRSGNATWERGVIQSVDLGQIP